jgi:hypothetical protein
MDNLRTVVTGIDTFKAPEKTKKEHVRDFIKSMAVIDDNIKPYREQKSDLKKSYSDNNYLSRSDQKIALKAYRLLKDKVDMAQLDQFLDQIKDMKIVEED